MFERKTQTAEYWGPGFEFSDDDVLHLYDVVADKGAPCSTEELALALIDYRCRKEEALIREDLSKGELYQPRGDYEVGQKLVFPLLGFATGAVVEKRPGANPEHGDFQVIKVQFEGKRKLREFAAALSTPHKLNLDDDTDALLARGSLMGPGEIWERLAPNLPERLAEFLGTRSQDGFAYSGGAWLVRDMLAEVGLGRLNIAEALIEMARQPLASEKLAAEIDLQDDISAEIALFSVNHALANDERFDDIGAAGEHLWYLRRLEPEGALRVPEPLRYEPRPYDRSVLSPELLRLAWELGDEWSDEIGSTPMTAPSVTLLLSYPHLEAGTLPLSFRTRSLFPSSNAARSMVTLVDGRWGQKLSGWAVRDGRYVVGLGDWYKEHKVPVGAYIVLQHGKEHGEVLVDIRPRRMRREWARMARVEDKRLIFEMRKLPIACEYDDHMLVQALEPEAIDELRQSLQRNGATLEDVIADVFPELLKLSAEGRVHAKTLYSAVNLSYRCPPGPIFAALSSSKKYRSVGDGEWAQA